MRITKIVVAGVALLGLGSAATQAAGVDALKLVRAGNDKGAAACVSCHGAEGAGQAAAGFPRLAGLDKNYLAKQLRDFQAGQRSNPVMRPFAQALSEAEIAAVAEYYSGLPVPAALEPQPDEALVKTGERLAEFGNWSKGVPACYQCHGPEGRGVATHFPTIAPQSATYIASQLHDWKTGSRHNDPVGLMKAVAERLSEDEIKAVSAYLASRSAPGAR